MPEIPTTKFTPSRAGIINLWDYRDEEFVFVDGWLVLRGPNGSGKTKALEVLFPFLLDGRIEPRRLNPFASEDRTMKSNLLYRGQEVAHAYVWMEFRRTTSSGMSEFVTIGIGLRAHRHVDKVTRHHFVTDGRVGVDFSLIDADDRPVGKRDLIGQLGQEHVFDAPGLYRRAVDARLFSLGADRYEQLLDLVLTLRKPQLAKDLNPAELSRTLQRGLRPLDDALIIEAAGSFDDMEAVARTLEGLIAADQATAGFLSIYSTYLRTHARAAADALTARRGAVAQRTTDVASAQNALRSAEEAYETATAQVAAADGEPGRLRVHLDRLKTSTAYQSHEQLADLKRHMQDLEGALSRAKAAATREQTAEQVRSGEVRHAESQAADAASAAARLARDLADEAEGAGIAWAIEDARPEGFAARAGARITARRDDILAVREQATKLANAERDHTQAAETLSRATAATGAAEQAAQAAEALVLQAREQVRAEILTWQSHHATLLDDLGAVHLTPVLLNAVDHLGEPGLPTLKETFTEEVTDAVTRVREQAATLRAGHAALVGQRTALTAERDRIAAEHDDAPRMPDTRTSDRTGRAGGPLWRLVRFTDDLPDAQAAAVEAALEAAGLLDAWIHPSPAAYAEAVASADSDGYLHPVPPDRRPAGRTLRDLLSAEEQQQDVPRAVIDAVLSSISVHDTLPPDASDAAAISLTGQYAHGVLLGAYAKPAPEYIGATARAARRAARIAECERLITDLTGQITAVERQRDSLQDRLAQVEAAARGLPSAKAVHNALRTLNEAATILRLRREAEATAGARLDHAVAEQAAAATALRRVVAERSLPVERVDAVTEAVRRFETTANRLEPARRAVAMAQEAAAAAKARHAEAVVRLEEASVEAHEAALRFEEKREEFQTLSNAVDDADVHRVLAEVAATEQAIDAAEARLAHLRALLTAADREQVRAGERVAAAQLALGDSVTEAHHDSQRLRPYAHADLLSILRCPTDLRWPAHPAEGVGALPSEITMLHEAILTATKELNPTETSLKQSATRLSAALTELQAQLPAAGLDHRPEWDTDGGIIVVRIADEQGLTPVAHFAERITRERQDQEQLLSDAERRILEDALLTQLARQIHHRTIESRDLVESMDTQMRARRMSSGLTIGVGWQLSDDLDPEQREACKLLDRDPARLGPAQLASLRRHFATRIKAARAMAPELPYRDLLAEVLDYRHWRTFKFTLHRPGGTVEQLTRARHSQLSGGEQSVSLHLPLFAAANALFGSARPEAPRMLGLDEAFAGVDENGRGELMALATQFDLDLFMTGYDLWATHPAVVGAAHYDLSHSALDHAVATVLVVWNGSVTIADFDGTLPAALGSPETRRVPGQLAADALEVA